ncbi:hypothetical protein D3C73_1668250 [compost metagenome]
MKAATGALMGNGILEIADEVHRAFDLVLEVGRKRPITITVAGPPVVEPAVEDQREFVGTVAEKS